MKNSIDDGRLLQNVSNLILRKLVLVTYRVRWSCCVLSFNWSTADHAYIYLSIEFYEIWWVERYLQKVQMLRRKNRIARFVNWIQTQNGKRILIIFKSFQRYAIPFNLAATRLQLPEFVWMNAILSPLLSSPFRHSQSPYHLAMIHWIPPRESNGFRML